MQQFILIAYDAKDSEAPQRRAAARQAHTELMSDMRKSGNILCGVAIKDDEDKMIGSVVITNFASREALDNWLANEPYQIHNVWGEITVLKGSLGLAFADLLNRLD